MKKNLSRLKVIAAGGLFRIIGSFSNLIISLFIIRTQSTEIWGEVVYFILFIDLGFSIVNWGHSPYLAREFSQHPKQMRSAFLQSFLSRAVLLIMFMITSAFIIKSTETLALILIWCASRFIYQSFDPVNWFERNFKFSVTLEVSGILIITLPIGLLLLAPTVTHILLLYAFSFLFRATMTVLYYRNFIFYIREAIILPSIKTYFFPAFPFFLLTVSAIFQQRADLYAVAFYLTPTDTAKYQVLLNLLIFSQTGASYILSPFAKNIFRLSPTAFRKLEVKFAKVGIILSFFSVVLIYIAVKHIYHFNFNWILYLMGYFYILFFYFYQVKNYELGKSYKQITVASYSFAGSFVNIIVSILLTPSFGIEGALMAGLSTQIFLTILYHKDQLLKLIYADR